MLRKADIVHPWFVGRYNEETYGNFRDRIPGDIAWCKENKVDYVPTVFPGFSWHNMYNKSPMNQIPRNRGKFYWKQIAGAIGAGAEMLYVAMFDEVDEGTAIFKASKNPPVGASNFVTFEEDVPSDYYLTLTGYAGKMLRREIPFIERIPGTAAGVRAGEGVAAPDGGGTKVPEGGGGAVQGREATVLTGGGVNGPGGKGNVSKEGSLTSWVDPYIGSGGHGHVFVGASQVGVIPMPGSNTPA